MNAFTVTLLIVSLGVSGLVGYVWGKIRRERGYELVSRILFVMLFSAILFMYNNDFLAIDIVGDK